MQAKNEASKPTITEEEIAHRNALFHKYIEPNLKSIYSLCKRYSYSKHTVDENYSYVLENFLKGICTYNPNLPLHTWIHIVAKRHILAVEKRRRKHELQFISEDDMGWSDIGQWDAEEVSYKAMDETNYHLHYSDDVLRELKRLPAIYRDAILLQESGYSLKEIMEKEFAKGSLQVKNLETVKTRLFAAKQKLKTKLTRDGERKSC